MSLEDPREREDLCGRELAPWEPGRDLAEEYDPTTWYVANNGIHYCCREVWSEADDGQCIWHADVEEKPADELVTSLSDGPARLDRAKLRGVGFPDGVNFANSRLRYANLRDADICYASLSGADLFTADLTNANLRSADLSEADLGSADLAGANLTYAVLKSANLFDAHLVDARLQGADFASADLGSADLGECYLHQTRFDDATFTETTTFGVMAGFEVLSDAAAADESRFATHVSDRFRALGRPYSDPHLPRLAETQYRTIQRLKRENDLKQDPELEIREKHARRKRALTERRYWDWFKLAFYRWPMGYGEKPTHVVATSVAVIFAAMLAYPHAGGFERTTGATTAVADLSRALAVPEPVTSAVGPWLTSFYFSVVTFTTVGYGDLQPATEMGRLLASVESFLGALLMALLVFVLGRRATW